MRQWLEKPFYCHTFPNPTLSPLNLVGPKGEFTQLITVKLPWPETIPPPEVFHYR